MTSFRLFAVAALAMVLGSAAWWWGFGHTPAPPPELVNVVLPAPKALAPFQLTGNDGAPFGPKALQDRWTVLFFGYTHCPDICPTTLLTLQQVRQRLEGQPAVLADTQFLFVSVDPKRDTPEHLDNYVRFFDPSFVAATGERSEIDRLVGLAGAVYMFEGDTAGDDYIVNHSATLYLVDPEGRLVARISPPHAVEEVVDLYLRIRRHYGDAPGA